MMLLAALLASVAMAGNLLPDSSFEEGKWQLVSWDRGDGKHEYVSPGRTGERCVHLVGVSDQKGPINELAISPVIKAEPGAAYVFAVWYRSTGPAQPFLSMQSFTQPFATAQWKTPRAQYIHKYLPETKNWHLGLWRFTVSEDAVEMVLMVRLAGVGEAWFDDASLAKVDDVRLTTICAGDVASLPDRRCYEARVELPSGTEWHLAVLSGGSELASIDGAGPKQVVSVPFSAPPGQQLLATLSIGGAVAAFDEFVTPPLLELSLVSGRYRNALFSSAMPKEVKAVLTAHAKPDVYRRISYSAALVPKDSCPATQKYRPMSRRAEEVRLAAKGLQPGEWRLLVQTQGAPGYEEMTVPLRVLPPGNPHEVIIDEYNRLLVDGKPMFPCGFYGAPDNDELTKPIADAGYNTVLTYAQDPEVCRRWLDMCQRLGLWGIVHVPRPFVPNFDEDKLRAAVRKVKDHPALLAYYLFDEPSPSRPGERPEDLKRVYDVLVDEDPYHPVTICINVPANERVYLESYDVLMIDVYPVRHVRGRLTEIAERMDHAWSSTEGRKPVWFIPQTFGWDVVVGLEGPPTWLTPTPEEERAMQYLALTHGARGSVAYCYHVYTGYDAEAKKKGQWPWKLGGYLPTQQKALWSALAQLGAEYKALQAALTQPAVAQAQFGTIHVAWFTDGGPDAWLLAVNGERDHKDEQAVPALPPEISRTPARAEDAFTGRPVELKAGKLNLRLNPMETVAIRTRLR